MSDRVPIPSREFFILAIGRIDRAVGQTIVKVIRPLCKLTQLRPRQLGRLLIALGVTVGTIGWALSQTGVGVDVVTGVVQTIITVWIFWALRTGDRYERDLFDRDTVMLNLQFLSWVRMWCTTRVRLLFFYAGISLFDVFSGTPLWLVGAIAFQWTMFVLTYYTLTCFGDPPTRAKFKLPSFSVPRLIPAPLQP